MGIQGKPIARPGRLPSSVPRAHSNRQTLRRVSATPAFTPASEPGLSLWYRGDSLTSAGGVVTGWTDLSTHHNDGSAGGAPAIATIGGGKPAASFQGSDIVSCPLVVGPTAHFELTPAHFTLAAVFNVQTEAAFNFLAGVVDPAGTVGYGIALGPILATTLEAWINDYGVDYVDAPAFAGGIDLAVIVTYSADAGGTLSVTLTPGGVTTTVALAGPISYSGLTAFCVGGSSGWGSLGGTLGEVVLYDHAISPAVQAQLAAYFAARYGL